MAFQPRVHDTLIIGSVTYRVAEHPVVPGTPYGQEGRQATVYQVVTGANRRALKVSKAVYRTPALVGLADKLAPFADLPGLQVCHRSVLTPQHNKTLVRQHPDLVYAVLMPWIDGPTWYDIMLSEGDRTRSPLTLKQSLVLAHALTSILTLMEGRGVAHCDLSGPNVLLPGLLPDFQGQGPGSEVALVDIEQLYAPGLERPQALTSASRGYNHPKAALQEFWGPYSDRFAGAVLLVEMLGACDRRFIEATWGESYFDPDEMQQDCDRYHLLTTLLSECWGADTAGLFERAWRSPTLSDCAPFSEWLAALSHQVVIDDQDTGTGSGQARSGQPGAGTAGQAGSGLSPDEELARLRSQAYALASQGQWRQVAELGAIILKRWPKQSEITPLLAKANQSLLLEQELEQSWQQALGSGRLEDWETCWRAAEAILQQAPKSGRYREIRDQAQQEMDWGAIAARADALVAEKRWDEAASLLETLPLNHPQAIRVRAHVELDKQRRQRLADLLKSGQECVVNGDWSGAIVACQTGLGLGGTPSDFQPLLDHAHRERAIDDRIAQLVDAARQAQQSGLWNDANAYLDEALTIRPQHTDLLAQQAQNHLYKTWSSQVAEASRLVAGYEWTAALTVLADVSEDFMDTAAIRARAAREIERQRRLAEARHNYDGKGVLALLADVDSNYPQAAELHHWAEVEIRRSKEIEEARRVYDGQGALTALTDAPSDYPHRLELYAWAQAEIVRSHQLAEARQAYDGEGVLAILADAPHDYPRLTELQEWAAYESARQTQIKETWETNDWEEVLALLDQAPADYPKRTELRQEAETNLLRLRRLQQWLEQAQASFEAHDWEATLAICQEALAVGSDEDRFGSLAEQARQAQQREQAITQAQSTIQTALEQGDWETALTHLRRLQALRPEQADIQLQIADVQQHQVRAQSLVNAQQACADQRWPEAIAALGDLPSDDDEAAHWRQKARAGWINELDAQAEAAESTADWSEAVRVLRQMHTLYPDDEGIARRLMRMEREQTAASSLALAQAAAGRGRWKEALAQAEMACNLFPDRDVAQTIIEQAQQGLITTRRRTRRILLGVGVLVALTLVAFAIVSILVSTWDQRTSATPSSPKPSVAISEPTAIPTQPEPATVRPVQSTTAVVATSSRGETKASVAPATTRPPTAVPAAPAYPAPELVGPQDGITAEGGILFTWKWTGPVLAANQGFEVRIWKQGQPDHYGAAEPVRTTNANIDVRGAYGVRTGGSGDFFWTVAIVQLNPYQRIGPEAPPRRLVIHVKD